MWGHYHLNIQREFLCEIARKMPSTMSSFLSGFKDTDVLFLEFDDKLSNVGGSFRWVTIQMRLNPLRLLGDVNSFDSLNWRGAEKPISPYAVCFSKPLAAEDGRVWTCNMAYVAIRRQ
uniref:Uncharacterized protein n=1 Tax=Cucumis melo TaxID=3656 RepID=A0A9I9ECY5_CUCME